MRSLFAYIWIAGLLVVFGLPFWLHGQGTISLPQFTEKTTADPTDIFWLVQNPSTTPQSRKITTANLLKRFHPCEIIIGNPNSNAAVLADGDDAPAVCANVTGSDQTITAVACRADADGASVLPVLTGGGTILTGAISCGNGTWVAGTVSGTPTIKSFAANGATCSATPCTLDAAIATAGGNARYAIIRFTISGQ